MSTFDDIVFPEPGVFRTDVSVSESVSESVSVSLSVSVSESVSTSVSLSESASASVSGPGFIPGRFRGELLREFGDAVEIAQQPGRGWRTRATWSSMMPACRSRGCWLSRSRLRRVGCRRDTGTG